MGHGRVEERAVHAFPTEGMDMSFPFARSVVVVRSRRTIKRSGQTTEETRHYLASLDPDELTSDQWHRLIRGHWGGVENRNHWRRDAMFGEDRSRSRKTRLLTNLALIRNALLRVLPRAFPGDSVPVIRERLQSNPTLAFSALGD
ncbi:MAG: ISAs1 family transposase [Verrucomicrobiota bacterium]